MSVEPIPPSAEAFTRRMLDADRVLIESVCDYCGLKIVATLTEGLMHRERGHRTHCSRPTSRASAA